MTPPSSDEYLKGESDIVLAYYADMHAAINLLSLMYSEKKHLVKTTNFPFPIK